MGNQNTVLDAGRLLSWPFRDIPCSYTDADAILYALSVGIGQDPTDERQLRFVYEKNLLAFPTMPIVLGMIDAVDFLDDPQVGIDLSRMLHGESGLTVHRPMPASGEVISRMAIDDLIDRGGDKGAVLRFSRVIRDAVTDDAIATETGTFILRGNGGFGGKYTPTVRPPGIPERMPDCVGELQTAPQSALLYRLTGDRNPLHVDPSIARRAKFPRPILHGSCTFGMAAHMIVRDLLGYDPTRLQHIAARFTAPVFPGELLRAEIWNVNTGEAMFLVRAVERDVVVLNNGICQFKEN